VGGVVVNNALVLIDYTNQLRRRGMPLDEAVVAAGATRLRAVIMGSVCTVLGVIPMIAGVSYDFHQMAIAWQSESTLWWRTMSTMVAAGLMVSTLLTLVVVPTVYALVESSKMRLANLSARIKAWYLKPFAQ